MTGGLYRDLPYRISLTIVCLWVSAARGSLSDLMTAGQGTLYSRISLGTISLFVFIVDDDAVVCFFLPVWFYPRLLVPDLPGSVGHGLPLVAWTSI